MQTYDDVTPSSTTLVDVKVPHNRAMVTQEARETWVRWYMNELLTANMQIAVERWSGRVFEGPRTMKQILEQPGPGGICPDESTLWRWLKSDWAAPIIREVVDGVQQAVNVSTDAVWPLVIQAQQALAISGRGRDSTTAAKFLAEQRTKGVVAADTGLGKIVADLVSSGRYDATITVQEQLTVRLKRLRDAQALPITTIEHAAREDA